MVNGWVERPITEVLKPNGIKIGPFGSQLKKEMLLSDGVYRVYGQENVYEHDFNLGDRYLTREHFNRLSSCEILPGDFVMSTMGTIGKCAIVPVTISRGIMDSHLIRLRFDEKKVRSDYILQLFSDQFHYLSNQTSRLAVGGIMDGLSVGIVSRLKVMYPESIEEQGKIIKTFSEVDKLIIDLQKLIRKKKDIRQGTMQVLVSGKQRLNGFCDEWITQPLEKLCKLITDGSHESPVECLDGFYMPSVKDMTDNGFDFTDCKRISKYDYERLLANGCKPEVGDVLIAKDGSMLKYVFPVKKNSDIVILSSIAILRPKINMINSSFLTYYFRQPRFVEQVINSNQTGTGVPRIVLKNFKKIELHIPRDIKEQKAIADILVDMDEEIWSLEKKVKKVMAIKQGMMEELLTGKIRLI